MNKTILVVDDDPGIVTMLNRNLTYEGYEVISAYNGEEALAWVEKGIPDLVILDIMLPKLDGWDVCTRIRRLGKEIPIIMLTAQDELENRVKGLDLGADDYVVKPFLVDELLARIRVQFRRSAENGEKPVIQYEDVIMNIEQRQAWRGQRLLDLKGKEFDLLQLLLENRQRVLSRDQIIEGIWGYDYEGESNVLEVYIASLRQKLEQQGEERLVQTIRGVGYVLRRG